jgi:hypothetical protein
MTKKPGKVVKKKPTVVVENIHSINNQEFRYPSLVTRIKKLMVDLVS